MRPDSTTAPCPLVIVGGGKAGLAAAREASKHGLPSLVLDEMAQLRDDGFLSPKIRVSCKTSVLNISADREILWSRKGRAGRFRADQIILATGSVPRIVPFPGWTLPGVVQAADVPNELESGDIRPGQKALVAGTDFDALYAATTLAKAGVEVVSLLVTGQRLSSVFLLLKSQSAAKDIKLLYRHTIFAANGSDRLETATFGEIESAHWGPVHENPTTIPVELLVVGFGRVARSELAMLAGCKTEIDPDMRTWRTVRDEQMRTTVSDILAVGDRSLYGGDPFLALDHVEGEIAGITAAERAGKLSPAKAELERAPKLEFLRKVTLVRQEQLQSARIRPGLCALADSSTIVCRCENVTCGAVQSAVEDGAGDVTSVKLLTRLGMGECQGRECSPSAAMLIAKLTDQPIENVGRINPRPPVRPVLLGALANLRDGDPLDGDVS